MLWNQNKAHSRVIIGLLLTTFVTACVKNSGKDQNPLMIQEKALESSELSKGQISGDNNVVLTDQSDRPAAHITKEYSFTLTQIQEFQINQGEVKNTGCSEESPFVHSFILVDAKGAEKNLHAMKNPELLVPGQYKLRVEIENGSLCKNVSMQLDVKTKSRDDLQMTDADDRGYQCHLVKENGSIQNNSSVRINTLPMEVIKVDGNLGAFVLADANTLCYKEIDAKTSCEDSQAPALKADHPEASTQRLCQNEGQRYLRAQAQLQVNRHAQATEIDFTCRHKGKVASLQLSDCQMIFNLGKELPIEKGQMDIMIRTDRMHISFDPIYSEIDQSQIPQEIYIGLARKTESNVYEPVLNSFDSISRDDLLDGRVRIQEQSLKNKVLSGNIDDLRLVFSRHPNLKQGLFHLNLKKLCNNDGNTLLIKTNATEKSLCE